MSLDFQKSIETIRAMQDTLLNDAYSDEADADHYAEMQELIDVLSTKNVIASINTAENLGLDKALVWT